MKRLQTIHPMTLVRDEKSLSGTVSYKYMMLILRTYNGSSRRFNLPIKQGTYFFMQFSFHIAEAVRKGGFCLHKEKGVDRHRLCNKRLWFSPGRALLCRPRPALWF